MKVPESMDYNLHSVEVESLSFDEILILTFLVMVCLKSYISPLEKQKTHIKECSCCWLWGYINSRKQWAFLIQAVTVAVQTSPIFFPESPRMFNPVSEHMKEPVVKVNSLLYIPHIFIILFHVILLYVYVILNDFTHFYHDVRMWKKLLHKPLCSGLHRR